MKSSVLSLVLVSATACATNAQDPQPPPAQYVSSQVILKFRSGSSGAAAVAQAVETGFDESSSMAAYVGDLGERLGTPLQAEQVTSGNEVIVGIDLQRFAEEAAEKLLAMEAVVAAENVTNESPGAQAAVTLRVSLAADSSAAIGLAQVRSTGAKTHKSLDDFIASASRESSLPLVFQLDDNGELVVLVDLLQVTEELTSRLGELEDVEYAELNQILQHTGLSQR